MRLTRVQQQQRTHEQLLDAGLAVFLRRGYLSATVEEIAAEAGFTRGAVYKHFGGKEGLWQAIVDARAGALLDGLRAALDRAGSRDELLEVLNPAAFVRDPAAARWTLVSAEHLAAVAGRSAHQAETQRRLDEAVAADLDRHCHRLGIRPAVPLAQFVVAWGALGGGLALLHAVDPSTDVATVAAGVLAALLPAPSSPSPSLSSSPSLSPSPSRRSSASPSSSGASVERGARGAG